VEWGKRAASAEERRNTTCGEKAAFDFPFCEEESRTKEKKSAPLQEGRGPPRALKSERKREGRRLGRLNRGAQTRLTIRRNLTRG